jgi:hypothetical protein
MSVLLVGRHCQTHVLSFAIPGNRLRGLGARSKPKVVTHLYATGVRCGHEVDTEVSNLSVCYKIFFVKLE